MLRNYNTTISFSETVYCTSFGYVGGVWNNTRWFWNNVKMDGDTVSLFWISTDKANVTVVDLFRDNRIVLTVTGETGQTCTVQVYTGSYGKPASVKGVSSWSFDESSKVLTFTVVPHSSVTVTIWFGVTKWFEEASRLLGQFFILFTLFATVRVIKGVSDWIGGRRKPKDVFGESFTKTIMWKIVETALVTATVVLLLNVVAGMF